MGVGPLCTWFTEGAVLLGGVRGGLLTCAVVVGALLVRPAPARVLGVLGWPTLLGLALWPTLVQGPDPVLSGSLMASLGLGLLVGLMLAVPRRLRWPREAVWVAWGVGLLTVVALTLGELGLDAGLARWLPPEQQARVSYGLVNGLIWSLLPAVAVAALVGRRGQQVQARKA